MRDYDDNSFYDDNSIRPYDAPPSGSYYPQYDVTPMAAGSRRRRRARLVVVTFLCVLALLMLTGGVYYLIHHVGVSITRTGSGFTLSLGTHQSSNQPADAQQPPAPTAPESSAPNETLVPVQEQPSATTGTGVTLPLSESPLSVQTVPSDDDDALSLQQIYQNLIASVVSISSATPSGTFSGTGIIMSEDGYVITNHHVIENAQVISVLTSDNTQYDAQLVGSDETSDIAVLKMDATGLQAAQFGDSTKLRVGDSVVAIGDPLGVQLRGTMTNGIISAINRDLTVGDRTMTLIQTNAALNNGNSGGPLINCYGQVIGINTMKMSSYYSSATVEGLGFAIPIAVAKPIIDELIENGYVAGRPAIGITGETLPKTFQTYYRLPSGIYVTSVAEGSDAMAKGLAPGDVITAINDTPVTTIDELNTVKNQYVAGDTVTLTVYRSGRYYLVEITLIDQATGR